MTTRRLESGTGASPASAVSDRELLPTDTAVPEQLSRFVSFPAGVLELGAAQGGDGSGIYAATGVPDAAAGQWSRSETRFRPTALGYLRVDVSGIGQLWDEACIRRLATRLGYDFAALVIYDPNSGRPPLSRVKAQATRLAAEAVIVPGPAHFPGARIPLALLDRLDVITCTPEETHSRRPSLLPDQPRFRRRP
ncbi:hypothetical protein ABZ319_22300 [Nocardia sp. NPDC005978]|uniref:hypothetical protein n=1 Tax=Nocardia sp. NPDC005978 TaxID=3156725 RepID=UPI0033B95122